MSRVSLQTRPLIESIPAEAVNRWTHGLGFAISLPAVAVLLAAAFRNGDMWVAISFLVYGVAMVGLYASSTLSHGFEDQPAWRQNFRIADQVCIYMMIAGTFTPFAVACMRDPFGLSQLAAMWLLAGIGIAIRVRRRGSLIGLSDLALCLLTAWIPILSLSHFAAIGGPEGFALIIAGAVFYTGGTVFLMNDHRNPYLHGVWHVSTLAGTGCHYLFLLNFVAAG